MTLLEKVEQKIETLKRSIKFDFSKFTFSALEEENTVVVSQNGPYYCYSFGEFIECEPVYIYRLETPIDIQNINHKQLSNEETDKDKQLDKVEALAKEIFLKLSTDTNTPEKLILRAHIIAWRCASLFYDERKNFIEE